MSISINTNLTALMTYKGLQSSTASMAKSMQRLSTGLRINSASDDAGGLAVATRMTAQIRGLNMVKQNVNDGISAVDVAYSALEETANALQSIREMAVEARSSTRTTADRTALDSTAEQLVTEIARIAADTSYNGYNLLTGSFAAKAFQIGADAGDTVTVTISAASLAALSLGAAGVSVNLTSAGYASKTIGAVDDALDKVSAIRAQLSGIQSRFESILNTTMSTSDGYTAALAGIMDTDVALESANLAKSSIIQQAGISVLAQANMQPQLFLKLLE